jgi:hypothetical protein
MEGAINLLQEKNLILQSEHTDADSLGPARSFVLVDSAPIFQELSQKIASGDISSRNALEEALQNLLSLLPPFGFEALFWDWSDMLCAHAIYLFDSIKSLKDRDEGVGGQLFFSADTLRLLVFLQRRFFRTQLL